MKIEFFGHAAFLITSETGVRIITDPYKPGCFDGGIKYGAIAEEADIVTVSHEHDDHNETRIKGNPVFVRDAKSHEVKGVTIKGIEVFHDTNEGKDRGRNIIFAMDIDGMNVVHAGDLGHALSDNEIDQLGDVDVLLVPVGGYFTIDASGADRLVGALRPRIVIPMHYKTDKCGFPIAPVENYTKSKDVKHVDGALEVTKEMLPDHTMVVVLNPSK